MYISNRRRSYLELIFIYFCRKNIQERTKCQYFLIHDFCSFLIFDSIQHIANHTMTIAHIKFDKCLWRRKRFLWLYLGCIHVIYGVCNGAEWFIAINNRNIYMWIKQTERWEYFTHDNFFIHFHWQVHYIYMLFLPLFESAIFFHYFSCIYKFCHVRIDQTADNIKAFRMFTARRRPYACAAHIELPPQGLFVYHFIKYVFNSRICLTLSAYHSVSKHNMVRSCIWNKYSCTRYSIQHIFSNKSQKNLKHLLILISI